MASTTGSTGTTIAIDWLDVLEEKVREATQRLGELKEENRALTRKIEDLESQLAATQGGESGKAWEAEREEIRRRVEKLTLGLEALIGE
jgi:predicted RNase H-like nuclease (RuvC/YqgF family)